MSVKDRGIQVDYLGAKELYISKIEKKDCRFYKIKDNIPIENKDYFTFHIKEVGSNEKEHIIVIFNKVLQVEGKEIKDKAARLEDKFINEFYYNLAYHYMLEEALENAEVALAYTEDIAAYQDLVGAYNLSEKSEKLEKLKSLMEDPSKRYRKGRIPIKIQAEEETLCLLEVLKMIMDDKHGKLLWKYEYSYQRIHIQNRMVEDEYHFIYPEAGFGDITEITIGSKRLNVGVRAKIEGIVEEKATGLRIGACVYRDYNLILDGNLNTSELWCELSPELMKVFRREKLIKRPIKLASRTIYPIHLSKLKVTNERMLKAMEPKEIVNTLYEIQILGCKERMLKKILATLIGENEERVSGGIVEEQARKLKKRFQINEKGIYKPFKVEKREELSHHVYPARVLEWKIEKFPLKKEEEKALLYYEILLEESGEKKKELLKKVLKEVSMEKRRKQNQVNLVRLVSGLMKKDVFIWDNNTEKEKVETDKVLEMNTVLGSKVQVSTKRIDGIVMRQEYYRVLTRYTSE